MKKAGLILLVIICQLTFNCSVCVAAWPHKSPGKTLKSTGQKADLVLLGKLWGFLKYHHPAVTKGSFDWDKELINILPGYTSCKNKTERNLLLFKWINGLGTVPATEPAPDSLFANAKLKPDYSWIKKSGLSADLVNLLTQISNYHTTENQRYIQFFADDDVVIPSFTHEDAYTAMAYPAADYRVLAVYRYWNMIEYWYPYKYLSHPNWDSCLGQFITGALAAGDEVAYAHLIQKMVAAIHDSHATVVSKKVGELNGLQQMPFTVKFIENQAVVNSTDAKLLSGIPIETGNILKSVDGVLVARFVESRKPYISASNNAVLLREAAGLLTRTADSTSQVTVMDNAGQSHSYTVKNHKYNSFRVPDVYDFGYQRDSGFFILPGNILYINAGAFKDSQVALIKPYLKTVKGIVLDARQYPKSGAGSVISVLQGSLLAAKAPMSKFSSVVKGYPGLFRYTKPFVIGDDNPDYYRGPVAILVNDETQSTGEFLTMAYKLAPKAFVVGSSTAGADGNVTQPFALPGGFYTQITGLGVYYPDSAETQQIGIVPDVKVKQTIAGYRKHKDELLDKAIEVISSSK